MRVGWRYLSFRTAALADGETIDAGAFGQEAVVVVIAGGGVHVDPGAAPSVARPARSDLALRRPALGGLPAGRHTRPGWSVGPMGRPTMVGSSSPSPRRRHPAVHVAAEAPYVIGPDDIEIEIRGAGNATRQINKIVAPETAADRLLVVEVLTPSGNWSSWPPHKHDVDDMPNEAVLEEVYYYRFRRPAVVGHPARLPSRSVARLPVRGPRWRLRHRHRWLPPLRGRPRRRRLLPQRAGRGSTDDGLLVRPGPRSGPRGLVVDGARPARPARRSIARQPEPRGASWNSACIPIWSSICRSKRRWTWPLVSAPQASRSPPAASRPRRTCASTACSATPGRARRSRGRSTAAACASPRSTARPGPSTPSSASGTSSSSARPSAWPASSASARS